MRFISHRGNLNGKDEKNENRPEIILHTISMGFDVEIDVWEKDRYLFLGHDSPDHKIDIKFLENLGDHAWIHAKNISAVEILSKTNLRWFWHENDAFTLTSKNEIWAYPEVFIENSVINQPKNDSLFWKDNLYRNKKFLGICHDDIETIRRIITNCEKKS